MAGKDPGCDPTSLGNLLLEKGLVTPKQLSEAVHFQQNNADLLLGEALVRLGVITREVLEATLAQQEMVRKGASRQSNDQVQRMLRMAAQHTLSVASGGTALVQGLQTLVDKIGSK